jgi:hypothetical protein
VSPTESEAGEADSSELQDNTSKKSKNEQTRMADKSPVGSATLQSSAFHLPARFDAAHFTHYHSSHGSTP